jgi:hypothetical protein
MIISGSLENYPKASQNIRQWKIRGKLPISVEATGFILELLMIDGEGSEVEQSNALMSLASGQLIARFVNLVTDLAQKGVYAASVDGLAASIGIPSWLVHTRHATTHGARYPPFRVLRKACEFLLNEFIIPRYWTTQMRASSESASSDTLSTTKWTLSDIIRFHDLYLKSGDTPPNDGRIVTITDEAIHWLSTWSQPSRIAGGIDDVTPFFERFFWADISITSQRALVECGLIYGNVDLVGAGQLRSSQKHHFHDMIIQNAISETSHHPDSEFFLNLLIAQQESSTGISLTHRNHFTAGNSFTLGDMGHPVLKVYPI